MEQNGENVIGNFTSQDKPTTELLFSAFDLLNDGNMYSLRRSHHP